MNRCYVVDGDNVYRADRGDARWYIGTVWLSPMHAPLWHVDWHRQCLFAPTHEAGIDLLIGVDSVATMYETEAREASDA